MRVTIEFYGIPRQRTEVSDTVVEFSGNVVSFRELLHELRMRFPRLADECIHDSQLADGYSANLAGERFITDADTTLTDGATLLIMSSDAGG